MGIFGFKAKKMRLERTREKEQIKSLKRITAFKKVVRETKELQKIESDIMRLQGKTGLTKAQSKVLKDKAMKRNKLLSNAGKAGLSALKAVGKGAIFLNEFLNEPNSGGSRKRRLSKKKGNKSRKKPKRRR